jgi:hypothetical protein
MMLYDADSVLDNILCGCISSGIKGVATDEYYITVWFGNGNVAKMWNANKYFAWLTDGTIYHQGKRNVHYQWSHTRPTKKTMRVLRRAIAGYYTTINE